MKHCKHATNGFQNTSKDLHELFTIPAGNTLFSHALLHCIFWRDWEVMSKTRASCFIRGSKHLETIKALGLRPRAFISSSVFGTPDETLALVFDILLQTPQTFREFALIFTILDPDSICYYTKITKAMYIFRNSRRKLWAYLIQKTPLPSIKSL